MAFAARWQQLSGSLFVFACAVVSYWNTLPAGFLFDDNFAVISNGDVSDGSMRFASIWKHDFWGQDIRSPMSHKSYRPLTILSFRLVHKLWRLVPAGARASSYWAGKLEGHQGFDKQVPLDPLPFHLVNTLMHAAVSVLVYWLALRLFELKEAAVVLDHVVDLQRQTHGTGGNGQGSANVGDTGQGSAQAGGSRRGAVNRSSDGAVVGEDMGKVVQEVQQETTGRIHVQALVAALLFALHPVHTEAVAGIVGHAEVLSALFGISALLLYMKAADGRYPAFEQWDFSVRGGARGRPQVAAMANDAKQQGLLMIGCLSAVLAAALAKEIGITVVGAMLVYDMYVDLEARGPISKLLHKQRGRGGSEKGPSKLNAAGELKSVVRGDVRRVYQRLEWQRVFRLLLLAAVAGLYIKGRGFVAGDHLVRIYRKMENPIPFLPTALARALTTAHLHARYFLLLLVPHPLSADWSYNCIPPLTTLSDPRNLLALTFYLFCLRFLLLARPWGPPLAALSASLGGRIGPHGRDSASSKAARGHLNYYRWTLLPMFGLMIGPFVPAANIFFYVGTFIGERLLYMPSVGGCILMADLLGWVLLPLGKQGAAGLKAAVAYLTASREAPATWLVDSLANTPGSSECRQPRPAGGFSAHSMTSTAATSAPLPDLSPQFSALASIRNAIDRCKAWLGRNGGQGYATGCDNAVGGIMLGASVAAAIAFTSLRSQGSPDLYSLPLVYQGWLSQVQIVLMLVIYANAWFVVVVWWMSVLEDKNGGIALSGMTLNFMMGVATFIVPIPLFLYISSSGSQQSRREPWVVPLLLIYQTSFFLTMMSCLMAWAWEQLNRKKGKSASGDASKIGKHKSRPQLLLQWFQKGALAVVVLLLLGTYAALTWQRNKAWHNEASLFRAAYDVCPESTKVNLNMGILMRREGNFSAALAHFQKARAIEPTYCEPAYWEGLTLLNLNKADESTAYLAEALDCKYVAVDSLKALATVLQALTEQSPDYGEGYVRWGQALMLPAVGRMVEGCNALEKGALLYAAGRARNLTASSAAVDACVAALRAYHPPAKAQDIEYPLLPPQLPNSTITNSIECARARRKVYSALTMREPTSGPVKRAVYKYITTVAPRCRGALRDQQPLSLGPGNPGLSAHMFLLHKVQSVDAEDPWLQAEWGETLAAEEGRIEEAVLHLQVSAAILLNQAKPVAKQRPGTVGKVLSPEGTGKVTPQQAAEGAVRALSRALEIGPQSPEACQVRINLCGSMYTLAEVLQPPERKVAMRQAMQCNAELQLMPECTRLLSQ